MLRAPTITRESTSRPSWSVPNQCALEGAFVDPEQVLAQRVVRREHPTQERAEHPEHDDHRTDQERLRLQQLAQELAPHLPDARIDGAGRLDGRRRRAHSLSPKRMRGLSIE